MGCSEYVPLISRFLDDDLCPAETETLLDHISRCPACREELDAMESLRSAFLAIGEIERVPWPEQGFVERALACIAQAGRCPESVPAVTKQRYASGRRMWSFVKQTAMRWASPGTHVPAWTGPLRYVVAVLVVLALGLLLMPTSEQESIDVATIQPTNDIFPPFGVSPSSIDDYVFHHATQQQLGNYWDELPLIQKVSDSGR